MWNIALLHRLQFISRAKCYTRYFRLFPVFVCRHMPLKTHITNQSSFQPRVQCISYKRNIAFDWMVKEETMTFRSGISVALTACLLVNAFAYSAIHGTTLSKLKALQSLVFNNAKATVTLDSTALKQLMKLAANGK